MKLTEERLVKMILEELDAMGEGAGGTRRARGTVSPGFKGGGEYTPPEKGTEEEEAKKALALQVNPIVTVIKRDLIKGSLPVEQEVYNAIQKRKDLTDDQKARVILKED